MAKTSKSVVTEEMQKENTFWPVLCHFFSLSTSSLFTLLSALHYSSIGKQAGNMRNDSRLVYHVWGLKSPEVFWSYDSTQPEFVSSAQQPFSFTDYLITPLGSFPLCLVLNNSSLWFSLKHLSNFLGQKISFCGWRVEFGDVYLCLFKPQALSEHISLIRLWSCSDLQCVVWLNLRKREITAW